jgi:hypothetical protein
MPRCIMAFSVPLCQIDLPIGQLLGGGYALNPWHLEHSYLALGPLALGSLNHCDLGIEDVEFHRFSAPSGAIEGQLFD